MNDILAECFRYWPGVVDKSVRHELVGSRELIFYMDDGSQWCYDSDDKSIRKLRLDNPSDDICGTDDISDERWCREFGERLRIYMHDRGITQDELADRSGVRQSYLSKYINGKNMPGARKAVQLAKALGCDISDLVGF